MSAYTIPYQIIEGGQLIHDAEWAPGERYTIAGIIAHSSNIGISQVAAHVTPQVQYDYLRAFGLGQPSGLGLPGETGRRPAPVSQWWPDTRYTLAFGQGVAVTAIQMAEVYATIANDGVRVQPTLVEGTTNAAGKYTAGRAVPVQTGSSRPRPRANCGRSWSRCPAIDEEGGQPWGIIPGYAIAAKTGTSQESNGTCALCVYGSSYIGMAPGDDPQARHRGQRAEPAQGRLLRRRGGRPGLLPGDEGRAGHAADPAGRSQSRQHPPERAVIGGTLTPWRSDLPASSRGRCPLSARCSGVRLASVGTSFSAERPGVRHRRHPRLARGGSPATCMSRCPAARVHGAAFCADAVAAGAVAILTDPDGRGRRRGQRGAGLRARRPARPGWARSPAGCTANPSSRLRLIGVTGTSGKTTSTYLIESGLRAGRPPRPA